MIALMLGANLLAPIVDQVDWKTDPHQIFLHRAAGMAAPENTIPALEEAVRQGADGVEIDVRRTADGHLVLYHDDWIYWPFGAGTRIEDLTLAEVANLDVGARWGERWQGLRTPRLDDTLRFARANRLLVFLDIKTPDIDASLREVIQRTGSGPWIALPDRLAGISSGQRLAWVRGWNYLDGGEEDAARMKEVAKLAKGPTRFMTDDARTLAAALGRQPERRPFVPFRATPWPNLPSPIGDLAARDPLVVRRALRQGAIRRDPERVRLLAASSPDPRTRLDALWALGSVTDAASRSVLEAAAREPDAADPKLHPSGMAYFDTFRNAAVAGAAVRRGDEALRNELKGPFAEIARALAESAYGSSPSLVELAGSADSGIASFALSHAYRHPFGPQAMVQALQKPGMNRRVATFGLAWLGPDAERYLALPASDPDHRAAIERARRWAAGGAVR
jgi:hypothetical protein